MRPVGWRVRLLGSGEGEVRAVFLCSCVLAARRGRLRGGGQMTYCDQLAEIFLRPPTIDLCCHFPLTRTESALH